MAEIQESVLGAGETTTLQANISKDTAEVIVDPGGDSRGGPARQPISSYDLDIQTGSPGELSAVDGSPVSSSSLDRQGYIVGDVDSIVEVTVTNTGSTEGSVLVEVDRVDEPVYPSANSDRRILSQKVENLQLGNGNTVGDFSEVSSARARPAKVVESYSKNTDMVVYNNKQYGGTRSGVYANEFTSTGFTSVGSYGGTITIPSGSGFPAPGFVSVNLSNPTTTITDAALVLKGVPGSNKQLSKYGFVTNNQGFQSDYFVTLVDKSAQVLTTESLSNTSFYGGMTNFYSGRNPLLAYGASAQFYLTVLTYGSPPSLGTTNPSWGTTSAFISGGLNYISQTPLLDDNGYTA